MTDLPLGDPVLLSACCMVNILGDSWAHGTPRWDRALALPGVRLHLYGKAEPRAGRKMGHLTCLADTPDEALLLPPPPMPRSRRPEPQRKSRRE